MNLAFDLLLVAALLWSAWRTLATADIFRAVILFIVFGLLMTLAWARLAAPDIALAEAAIGAGLTGALLLDAIGVLRDRKRDDHLADRVRSTSLAAPPWGGPAGALMKRALVVLAAAAFAVLLIAAMLDLPSPVVNLPTAVAANMAASGVEHPVTAVLLNFRGYDTLLEIGVLLLALLVVLAVSPRAESAALVSTDPVLQTLARIAVPLMLLAAVYLLWAGAHRPGGAFQAGAVLAAAAVLLHLAGLLPGWDAPQRRLRWGLAGGFLVFLGVAAALLTQGALLAYPPATAGALILLIEAALTLSLGLILAGLFLFLARDQA